MVTSPCMDVIFFRVEFFIRAWSRVKCFFRLWVGQQWLPWSVGVLGESCLVMEYAAFSFTGPEKKKKNKKLLTNVGNKFWSAMKDISCKIWLIWAEPNRFTCENVSEQALANDWIAKACLIHFLDVWILEFFLSALRPNNFSTIVKCYSLQILCAAK
jgi:hypothetical protein